MVLRETSVAHPISLATLPEPTDNKMRTAKFESSLIWEDKHTNALVLLEGNCIHCYKNHRSDEGLTLETSAF